MSECLYNATLIGDALIQSCNYHGEPFYSLADIMEKAGTKPKKIGDAENAPQKLSGRIIWGRRTIGMNRIESVFVDRECAENLLAHLQVSD